MKITYKYFLILIGPVFILIPFLPLLSDEKRLPLNGYFPLDWQNSEIAYGMIYAFIMYELILCVLCGVLSNFIVWYQIMACGTKYEILRNEFTNMFIVRGETKSSVAEEQQLFLEELHALIKTHLKLREYTSFLHY